MSRETSIMSKLRFVVVAMIAAVSPIAFAAGGGTARADPPAPGDTCTVLHATTKDVNGRMMWCNATMTGDHTLVWQYGGPS
jgi:hypothetical protein